MSSKVKIIATVFIIWITLYSFKDIENIRDFFEIEEKGNWENKIILIEKKKASKKIVEFIKNLK